MSKNIRFREEFDNLDDDFDDGDELDEFDDLDDDFDDGDELDEFDDLELQSELEAMTEWAEQGEELLMEGFLIMVEQEQKLNEAQAKIIGQDLVIGVLTKFVIPAMEEELQNYKDEEAFEARLARNMAESLEMPNLAKWALQSRVEVIADGMTITFYPSRSGRTIDSHSEINGRGDITKTVTHLKGEATVEMILPLFGKVMTHAILDRTETDCADAHFTDIQNTATFVLQIAGVERTIIVKSQGIISKSRNIGYPEYADAKVTPVACSDYGEFHGEKTAMYSAEVSIY